MAYAQPEDAVVLYSDRDWPIFDYHYPDEWFGVPNNWQVTPEVAETYLRPIWEEHDGLWLVTTQYAVETDPQGSMPAWLEGEAVAVTEAFYGDKALHFFARTPERAQTIGLLAESAAPRFTADILAGQDLRLVGFDLPSRTYNSGDPVHLGTYWTGRGILEEDSDLQIAVRDSAGNILPWSLMPIELDDRASESGLVRAETVVQIPLEVPSGHYSFGLLKDDGAVDTFANLEIRQRNRPFLSLADVTIATPLDIEFENGIRLIGL